MVDARPAAGKLTYIWWGTRTRSVKNYFIRIGVGVISYSDRVPFLRKHQM